MTDTDKTLVVALAAFAVVSIGVIGQLVAELRRERRELGAQRSDLVDETKRREETERLIGKLQAESQREFAETENRVQRVAQGLEAGEIRRRLYNEYALSHDGLTPGILNGTEPLHDDWVHGKLAEWGLPSAENPTKRPWWRIG